MNKNPKQYSVRQFLLKASQIANTIFKAIFKNI